MAFILAIAAMDSYRGETGGATSPVGGFTLGMIRSLEVEAATEDVFDLNRSNETRSHGRVFWFKPLLVANW